MTVVFDVEATIDSCISLIIGQLYSKVEYIIIDGGSTDKTINTINSYKHYLSYVILELDGDL